MSRPPGSDHVDLLNELDRAVRTLATARATLRDVPRIHPETAVEPLAREAEGALDGFGAWLRAGLRDDAGPGRDQRLGRRRWAVRAWHDALLAHGSPPPRHLRTLLEV